MLSESTGVQNKAMGKIKFLNFVQMVLDKNRLKDSHCKFDSGIKVVGFCRCCFVLVFGGGGFCFFCVCVFYLWW